MENVNFEVVLEGMSKMVFRGLYSRGKCFLPSRENKEPRGERVRHPKRTTESSVALTWGGDIDYLVWAIMCINFLLGGTKMIQLSHSHIISHIWDRYVLKVYYVPDIIIKHE